MLGWGPRPGASCPSCRRDWFRWALKARN